MNRWDTEAEFNVLFRANLRKLRNDRQWSRRELAEKLGISRDSLKQYEMRECSMLPVYLVVRLADVMGIPYSLILEARMQQSTTGKTRFQPHLADFTTAAE